MLRAARRDRPRRQIVVEFRPRHASDFLAPLPGQDERPHDRVVQAGPVGRLPDGGEFLVGEHAVALFHRGDRKVGERIFGDRSALHSPLVAGAPVGRPYSTPWRPCRPWTWRRAPAPRRLASSQRRGLSVACRRRAGGGGRLRRHRTRACRRGAARPTGLSGRRASECHAPPCAWLPRPARGDRGPGRAPWRHRPRLPAQLLALMRAGWRCKSPAEPVAWLRRVCIAPETTCRRSP